MTIRAVPEAFKFDAARSEVVPTTRRGRVVEACDEVAWMEKSPQGVLLPTPTLPWESTKKAVLVAKAGLVVTAFTAKSGTFEADEVAETESLAQGVEDEIPKES